MELTPQSWTWLVLEDFPHETIVNSPDTIIILFVHYVAHDSNLNGTELCYDGTLEREGIFITFSAFLQQGVTTVDLAQNEGHTSICAELTAQLQIEQEEESDETQTQQAEDEGDGTKTQRTEGGQAKRYLPPLGERYTEKVRSQQTMV